MLETISDREHNEFVSYLPKSSKEDIIVEIILHVHLKEQNDNILMFVSDVTCMSKIIKKIEEALSELKVRFSADEIDSLKCWSLHASLDPKAQDDAVNFVAPVPVDSMGIVGFSCNIQ